MSRGALITCRYSLLLLILGGKIWNGKISSYMTDQEVKCNYKYVNGLFPACLLCTSSLFIFQESRLPRHVELPSLTRCPTLPAAWCGSRWTNSGSLLTSRPLAEEEATGTTADQPDPVRAGPVQRTSRAYWTTHRIQGKKRLGAVNGRGWIRVGVCQILQLSPLVQYVFLLLTIYKRGETLHRSLNRETQN